MVKDGGDSMGPWPGEAYSCDPVSLWTASKGVGSVGSVEGVEGVEKVGVAGSASTRGDDCGGEARAALEDGV